MNREYIKKGLSDYDKVKVGVYLDYLSFLSTEKDKTKQLKNKWFQYQKDEAFISMYKKVAIDNLYIDGENITLTFKGKLMVSYDYQAYKNKVLNVYPETKFDFGIVYEGDKFSFSKESGKVIYKHTMSNPFENNRTIIGAYGIIKNNRGEFIETLNVSEIDKIKSTAKTKTIWDKWFDRMVLKSIVKRICKIAFKDQFKNIEAIDNENYDLDKPLHSDLEDDLTLKETIDSCETLDQLNMVYENNKDVVEDEKLFMEMLGAKKKQIKGL